jgi:hypothetical protein
VVSDFDSVCECAKVSLESERIQMYTEQVDEFNKLFPVGSSVISQTNKLTFVVGEPAQMYCGAGVFLAKGFRGPIRLSSIDFVASKNIPPVLVSRQAALMAMIMLGAGWQSAETILGCFEESHQPHIVPTLTAMVRENLLNYSLTDNIAEYAINFRTLREILDECQALNRPLV